MKMDFQAMWYKIKKSTLRQEEQSVLNI